MGLLSIPSFILIIIFIFAAVASVGFLVFAGLRKNIGNSESIHEKELEEDVKSLEEELREKNGGKPEVSA